LKKFEFGLEKVMAWTNEIESLQLKTKIDPENVRKLSDSRSDDKLRSAVGVLNGIAICAILYVLIGLIAWYYLR
jgi:hypothetical protein